MFEEKKKPNQELHVSPGEIFYPGRELNPDTFTKIETSFALEDFIATLPFVVENLCQGKVVFISSKDLFEWENYKGYNTPAGPVPVEIQISDGELLFPSPTHSEITLKLSHISKWEAENNIQCYLLFRGKTYIGEISFSKGGESPDTIVVGSWNPAGNDPSETKGKPLLFPANPEILSEIGISIHELK